MSSYVAGSSIGSCICLRCERRATTRHEAGGERARLARDGHVTCTIAERQPKRQCSALCTAPGDQNCNTVKAAAMAVASEMMTESEQQQVSMLESHCA
eukprot:6629671-Pyramimonas_sp.AAC.1